MYFMLLYNNINVMFELVMHFRHSLIFSIFSWALYGIMAPLYFLCKFVGDVVFCYSGWSMPRPSAATFILMMRVSTVCLVNFCRRVISNSSQVYSQLPFTVLCFFSNSSQLSTQWYSKCESIKRINNFKAF